MSPKQLHRRWQQRLIALDDRVRSLFKVCCGTGGAEAIHDLRVAIRRERQYARLGRRLLRKGSVKRMDAWGRTINELLGPIRDCDVCLNWLAGLHGATEVVQRVHEERDRLWRNAAWVLNSRRCAPPPSMKFRRHGKDRERKLSVRLSRELGTAAATVLQIRPRSTRMTPAQWHDLRRIIRRWRYLRELALPARRHAKDPLLVWLNHMQDALGESQNLEMAIGLLDALLDQEPHLKFLQRARREQIRWIARAKKALGQVPDTAN